MEGLKINIKQIIQDESTQKTGVVSWLGTICILVVMGLLIPFILLFLLFSSIFDRLPPRQVHVHKGPWHLLSAYEGLNFSWKWITPEETEELPDVLKEMYEEVDLMIFSADPAVPFLEGYFTDFKVERSDGVFLQKIELDESGNAIVAMPLYFLKYKTLETEWILDLKGFEIEDCKGSAEDFLITAIGEDEQLEIHLSS